MPRAVLGALAVAFVFAAPAWGKAGSCGSSQYSYAGLQGVHKSHGVAATLTALAPPNVSAGHVAAWVGVGWAGGGPNGRDEWIQAGMGAEAGYKYNWLYYEIVSPQAPYRYVEFRQVEPGRRHRIAVLEMEHHRNWWRVWVDGRPITRAVHLVRSHGAWEPVVTAESWNGDVHACNPLAYRFENVAWSTHAGGWWHRLTGGLLFADPGYRVVHPAASTFLTLSRIL
ncbi:MAG: hypothetical protein WBB74_05085 [Gaiellaceae bacterium]